MRYVLFSLALLISFAPLTTHAAFGLSGHIIPDACTCDSVPVEGGGTIAATPSAPAYGCVLQTIQNIIRLGIGLGIAVATLVLIYAGFIWMTSGGNPERRNQGSHLLLNVFVGLFVMLGAWLFVDFVMKNLYDQSEEKFGPWNNILGPNGDSQGECIVARNPTPIATGVVGLLTDAVTGQSTGGTGVNNQVSGTRGCPTCASLSAQGFTCTNSCTLDPQVIPRLVSLKQAFSGTWVVTEAYPPSASHTNLCHYSGTCIDAAFRGNTEYTGANIAAFSRAASGAGLRAVFETFDCALRDRARQAGVTAYCKTDSGYSHITGSHFSVYSN